MKKAIIILLCSLLCASVFIMSIKVIAKPEDITSTENVIIERDEIVTSNFRLIIYGENITDNYEVLLYQDFTELPFVEMLETLGAKVEWENDFKAKIKFNGIKYVLNTKECSLKQTGNSVNLLLPPPGGTRCYTATVRELFLDYVTLNAAFQIMEIDTRADVNLQNKTINVVSRTET